MMPDSLAPMRIGGRPEVSLWLRETGFGEAKARSFRTLPDLQMLVATAT
jgi:hypothetical protein